MTRRTLLAAPLALAAGAAADSPRRRTHSIFGQPSWLLSTADVEVAVTRRGGHMAPVTFFRNTDRPVRPYYVSPWQEEGLKLDVPVLVPLRGDFFCMPFGGNGEAHRGEQHPPHGEVAGSEWRLAGAEESGPVKTLTLELETRARPGRVTKQVSLVEGQSVVYTRHVVDGFVGRTPLGHHATLAVPEKEGSLRVKTSPFRFGMTNPGVFSDPAKREYQSFAPGARFSDLRQVPLLWKGAADADASRYPARTGFADLLLLATDRPAAPGDPAWVTATLPEQGYLWFSLKDPAVLPSTVMWVENHGRHASPWNGRNRCLGLEDVCAFFADGLAASVRPNVLNEQGLATSHELTGKPFAVNYIQGVVRIPAGFEEVRTVRFSPEGVSFVSTGGPEVTVPVRHGFLGTGRL